MSKLVPRRIAIIRNGAIEISSTGILGVEVGVGVGLYQVPVGVGVGRHSEIKRS
jgi:hypothetical protein